MQAACRPRPRVAQAAPRPRSLRARMWCAGNGGEAPGAAGDVHRTGPQAARQASLSLLPCGASPWTNARHAAEPWSHAPLAHPKPAGGGASCAATAAGRVRSRSSRPWPSVARSAHQPRGDSASRVPGGRREGKGRRVDGASPRCMRPPACGGRPHAAAATGRRRPRTRAAHLQVRAAATMRPHRACPPALALPLPGGRRSRASTRRAAPGAGRCRRRWRPARRRQRGTLGCARCRCRRRCQPCQPRRAAGAPAGPWRPPHAVRPGLARRAAPVRGPREGF
jgi:hypothetical protein